MQLTSFLTVALAAVATALPTEAPAQQENSIVARATHIGYVGVNNERRQNLYVNGGCAGNAGYVANTVAFDNNVRCRFFRDYNCGSLIGGTDGLKGIGRNSWQRTAEWYGSATCWFG